MSDAKEPDISATVFLTEDELDDAPTEAEDKNEGQGEVE